MNIEEKIKNKFLYSFKLNFFKIIYFYFQYFKSKIKQKKSYSNWGIDMLSDFFFKDQKDGIYIDVGCHHPFLNNNTYPLHKRGWKGINVDLDYSSIDSFNFFRKNDHNIQIAVSDVKGQADLYFFHNRAAKNTLSKSSGDQSKKIIKVQTDTLNNIISASKFKDRKIDFLSIDVEGFEINVLKGFDFEKYKPSLVVLEFIDPNIKEFFYQKIENILDSTLYKYMIDQDYKMINWIHDDLVFVPRNINN
jgi:FkbM family methyltransferase